MSASDNLNEHQFLYHVSPKYNKEDILAQGLDPNAPQHEWATNIPRNIYMTPSVEDAHKWGTQIELTHNTETPMSLFKVDVSGLTPKHKKTDIGLHEYSVPHHVEPERVRHVEDFNPQ